MKLSGAIGGLLAAADTSDDLKKMVRLLAEHTEKVKKQGEDIAARGLELPWGDLDDLDLPPEGNYAVPQDCVLVPRQFVTPGKKDLDVCAFNVCHMVGVDARTAQQTGLFNGAKELITRMREVLRAHVKSTVKWEIICKAKKLGMTYKGRAVTTTHQLKKKWTHEVIKLKDAYDYMKTYWGPFENARSRARMTVLTCRDLGVWPVAPTEGERQQQNFCERFQKSYLTGTERKQFGSKSPNGIQLSTEVEGGRSAQKLPRRRVGTFDQFCIKGLGEGKNLDWNRRLEIAKMRNCSPFEVTLHELNSPAEEKVENKKRTCPAPVESIQHYRPSKKQKVTPTPTMSRPLSTFPMEDDDGEHLSLMSWIVETPLPMSSSGKQAAARSDVIISSDVAEDTSEITDVAPVSSNDDGSNPLCKVLEAKLARMAEENKRMQKHLARAESAKKKEAEKKRAAQRALEFLKKKGEKDHVVLKQFENDEANGTAEKCTNNGGQKKTAKEKATRKKTANQKAKEKKKATGKTKLKVTAEVHVLKSHRHTPHKAYSTAPLNHFEQPFSDEKSDVGVEAIRGYQYNKKEGGYEMLTYCVSASGEYENGEINISVESLMKDEHEEDLVIQYVRLLGDEAPKELLQEVASICAKSIQELFPEYQPVAPHSPSKSIGSVMEVVPPCGADHEDLTSYKLCDQTSYLKKGGRFYGLKCWKCHKEMGDEQEASDSYYKISGAHPGYYCNSVELGNWDCDKAVCEICVATLRTGHRRRTQRG